MPVDLSYIEFDMDKIEYDISEKIKLKIKGYNLNNEEIESDEVEFYYNNNLLDSDELIIDEAGVYKIKAKLRDLEKEETIYVFNREFQVTGIEDIVMYEINPRAFGADGTLDEITEKLDYIENLGINTIWIMPTYPVGQPNKKGEMGSLYSIGDYTKVNPEMGTMEDFNELIIEAHKRDMAVIMDWVANHTAWDHPWISKHKEWYSQRNGEIIWPEGTDWNDVADLNFDNTTMQNAMIEDMKYWFEKSNIDGYRCDAADWVPMSFWELALNELENSVDRDIILLGEGANSQLFRSGFEMNYSWNFYSTIKSVFDGDSASDLINSNNSEYAIIPNGTHKLRFTTNHDETAWDRTPIEIFHGSKGAKAASVIATYLDGVPLFYNGQEVGCTDRTEFFDLDPIDWNEDLTMLEFYKDLIRIYNENEVLRKGTIQDYSNDDIIVFKKSDGNDEILVIVNVRNEAINYEIDSILAGEWEDMMTNNLISLGDEIGLGTYEYKIFKR